MLVEAGALSVRGIDISSEMLQLAKEAAAQYRDGSMSFWNGDLFELYYTGKFPLATAVFSMHYAQTREQLDIFLGNVAKTLTLNGKFVALLMDPQNPIRAMKPGDMCESRWLDEHWIEGSRIVSELYDVDGNKITSVTDYYWTRQTHEQLMLSHNLADIHWIKDGALLQTPLVILSARRSGNT
jgi:SAM-dependent methyltransferase